MVRNVAPLIRDLDPKDFHLLSGLEHGMRFSEWVNRDTLPSFSRLDPQEVDHRLDRCMDRELIERETLQYEGFRLKFEGYDALALHTFSERETVTAVGSPLGEGKESDVFEGMGTDPIAIKFHREGLTNFREVHRERDYTADHDHNSWLYTARKAAEREYEVLETLWGDVSVPEPIDQNRHAIVMELMDGVPLARANVSNPIACFESIVSDLERTLEAGFVHTDISAYNILIEGDTPRIFDWPQAVDVSHPNAGEFLKRDLGNLRSFFVQKAPHLEAELAPMSDLTERLAVNLPSDTV